MAGGTTTLTLQKNVASALTKAHVQVGPVPPAAATRAGGIAFPITGGRIDPATARGRILHAGGLSFRVVTARRSNGGPAPRPRAVVVRGFRVVIGRRAGVLSARAGAVRFPLLTLGLNGARVSRTGFGTNVSGVRAFLTRAGARALNGALRVSLFKAGMRIGTVTVRARPAQVALVGGSTALALSQGASQALQALGIQAAPIAPARVGSDGLNFPITGGRLNVRTFAGAITHSGGIRLSRGSTAVPLERFTIRIDRQPDLTAAVGAQRVSILSLDLGAVRVTASGRNLTLANVRASLTSVAAAALNATFGTTAFGQGGLELGTATVKARVR